MDGGRCARRPRRLGTGTPPLVLLRATTVSMSSLSGNLFRSLLNSQPRSSFSGNFALACHRRPSVVVRWCPDDGILSGHVPIIIRPVLLRWRFSSNAYFEAAGAYGDDLSLPDPICATAPYLGASPTRAVKSFMQRVPCHSKTLGARPRAKGPPDFGMRRSNRLHSKKPIEGRKPTCARRLAASPRATDGDGVSDNCRPIYLA